MNILGIETATRTGGVAIVSEEGVIAEYTLNIEVAHAERLMSTVERVLKDTGLTLSAIDGFGVSIGPGSFTGLRIGLATVKGLVFTTGKPVAAVLSHWQRLIFSGKGVPPSELAGEREVVSFVKRTAGAIGYVSESAAVEGVKALPLQ